MKTIFIVLSAVLTFVSIVPYIYDVIRKKTKPRVVSWFNWSLLTGIATAAAFSDKQYPSAVLTLAVTLGTLTIVVFGLSYGDRKFESFDVICQLGAVLGLILWIVFKSPLVAVLATVGIDIVAGLPTYRHSWVKPGEETTITYVVSTVASIFSLMALNRPDFLGIIYPAYLLLADGAISVILLSAPYRNRSNALQRKSQS
jgi:hypothetical protein